MRVDDERHEEDLKGFKNSLSSSRLVCVVFICVWVLLSYISQESILIIGNFEKYSHFVKF
jgi:hypothetical protein